MKQKSAHVVLILSILAVSCAAPLAKLLQPTHPMAIGFWRCLIIGALLSPFLLREKIPLKSLGLSFGAGFFLALHFWSWFASLQYTSTLRSTLLVCLNPIWVGLLEGIILKKMPSKNHWYGVLIALFGLGLMGLDTQDHEATMYGDLLALLGGILGALYLLVGRKVRASVSIAPYGAIICLSSALFLALLVPVNSGSLELEGNNAWLLIGLMALGPQLMGHIGLNYAMGYLSAAFVSLMLLFEPIGAALIAIPLLNELPSLLDALASLVIIIGLFVGTIDKNQMFQSGKAQ